MSDAPYFLDFLFNNIVDVHFGVDYLVLKGVGQETDTHMRTWFDGLFFDSQSSNNFGFGWDEVANQFDYAGLTGSIRIVVNTVIENVELTASDLSGKLHTPNGATLKNSFVVGVLNGGNSNATLLAFVSTENFKSQKLEINTVPEQPVPYYAQLFTLKSKDVGPKAKIGSILPSKAVSHSRVLDGGQLGRFAINTQSLKITNLP